MQTRGKPALSKIVVDYEGAVRLEVALDVFERLTSEQKTLEANIAVAAMQHERVDQRIDNQIVLPIARTQKVAAVVQVNLNALVLVRMVRMVLSSQAIDGRIDLDCVNMLSAPLQGPTDIITRTSADDQYIRKGRTACISIQQMGQCICGEVFISRHHLLAVD